MSTSPDRLLVARASNEDPHKESIESIKVLWVGDSQPSTDAMTRALSDLGVEVTFAKDSKSACRLLREEGNNVDTVLLDFDLPDKRCAELLPLVEALPKQPGIVILTTQLDRMQPEMVSYRAVCAPRTTPPLAIAKLLRASARGYARNTLERFGKCFNLNDKESAILERVANGVSPKQMAAQLDCSIQSIYAHLTRMSTKTSSASYQEVIAKLFQFSCHGLGHFSDE